MRDRMRWSSGLVAVVICWAAAIALAEEAGIRHYPLPDHGTLQLTVPASWKDEAQAPNQPRNTLRFYAPNGAPFQVLVTPMWPSGKDAAPPSAEWMRQRISNGADRAKAEAVEKTIEVRELQGAAARGYYFSATDRAPGPGEYKCMTQGMMRVGSLLVTFTILTNDGQGTIVADALAMLRSARHVEPRAQATDDIRVAAPHGEWELRFPRQGWTLQDRKTRADGNGAYVHFAESQANVNVSFFIEPATRCRTAGECREMFWANPGPGYRGAQGLERLEINGFAVMKCTVPVTFGGLRLDQLNYSAHTVREGYWVDLHISKAPAEGRDAEGFSRFVESVQFSPR